MVTSFFKYLFLIAAAAFMVCSCVKKTTYPTTPVIEYMSFVPFIGDSADLRIEFKDGDGNIGVSQGDTTRTLYAVYYYKDTVSLKYTAYYDPLFSDTLRTSYVVKKPNDSYRGKPISGEISVRLQQFRHSQKIKHVKYVIYLYDADGNKSNVITTPELTVQ